MTVEVSVVLAGVEASILFLYEGEERGLGRFQWSDFPQVKVLVDEVIGSLSFSHGEGI